jgi:hypothetical protein
LMDLGIQPRSPFPGDSKESLHRSEVGFPRRRLRLVDLEMALEDRLRLRRDLRAAPRGARPHRRRCALLLLRPQLRSAASALPTPGPAPRFGPGGAGAASAAAAREPLQPPPSPRAVLLRPFLRRRLPPLLPLFAADSAAVSLCGLWFASRSESAFPRCSFAASDSCFVAPWISLTDFVCFAIRSRRPFSSCPSEGGADRELSLKRRANQRFC